MFHIKQVSLFNIPEEKANSTVYHHLRPLAVDIKLRGFIQIRGNPTGPNTCNNRIQCWDIILMIWDPRGFLDFSHPKAFLRWLE